MPPPRNIDLFARTVFPSAPGNYFNISLRVSNEYFYDIYLPLKINNGICLANERTCNLFSGKRTGDKKAF